MDNWVGWLRSSFNQCLYLTFSLLLIHVQLFIIPSCISMYLWQGGIIIMFAGALMWWLTYYAVVYPSMIRFTNRQQYLHDSPIQKDLHEIKEMLQNENTSHR